MKTCLFPLLLLSVAGCWTAPAADRNSVSSSLQDRSGAGLGPVKSPGEVVLPNGASPSDRLSEEEAIVIALWNNAAFLELLTDLGVARGDLIQAGLLPNPEAGYFFPNDNKPFKYVFDLPLEALWLRPIRIKAARDESARVGERLVQAGLDLIRDVRVAYADLLFAQARLQVAREAVKLRGRISDLAAARLRAGAISAQEAATARIDHLQAQQDAARATYEVSIAEEKLRNRLGIGADRTALTLSEPRPLPRTQYDVENLVGVALESRPDLAAAASAVDAAAERLRLSRVGWIRFLGILDATSGKKTGHEFSPAFRATLPIFHWNQGAIARAEAELEKAARQRETLSQQIILDVRQAHYRVAQANAELDVLEKNVRPEVERAIQRAEKAYREGDTSYTVVLETTRQLLDMLTREAMLRADLRRAWAELERSVGRHVDTLDCSPSPSVSGGEGRGEGGEGAAPQTPHPRPLSPEAGERGEERKR